MLQGKHKPSYAHNLLSGDFVIVTNGDKFKVSGNKLLSKKYYRHSGYIGGLTEQTMEDMLDKLKLLSKENAGQCSLVLHLKSENGGIQKIKSNEVKSSKDICLALL